MRLKTVGAITLIGAAALFGGCQPAQQMPPPPAESEPLKLQAPEPETKPAVAKPDQPKKAIAKAPEAKKATKPVAENANPANTKPELTLADDATPASTPVAESRVIPQKDDDAQQEDRDDEQPIITTIMGCLERDGDVFRLKDTEGNHAPKSRSWKSGFIRRGSAKVDLVDASNRLKLPSHVGYRVSVSGTLVEREMHGRTIRQTSERCD
jgi:hypothetical protein